LNRCRLPINGCIDGNKLSQVETRNFFEGHSGCGILRDRAAAQIEARVKFAIGQGRGLAFL
jgi:hypothetical protein